MPSDRPTPIYTHDGEPFADDLSQAARFWACSRPTLYACTEPWQDGRRLVRAPGPAGSRIGRKGRPTLLPGETMPRPSAAAAARAAGVARQNLYTRSALDGETRVVRPATRGAIR
jgi:hypothetical protein